MTSPTEIPCRQAVYFVPHDGRQFLAIKPVTNINNAFAMAAEGVADTGTQMLAPGASLESSASILDLDGRTLVLARISEDFVPESRASARDW